VYNLQTACVSISRAEVKPVAQDAVSMAQRDVINRRVRAIFTRQANVRSCTRRGRVWLLIKLAEGAKSQMCLQHYGIISKVALLALHNSAAREQQTRGRLRALQAAPKEVNKANININREKTKAKGSRVQCRTNICLWFTWLPAPFSTDCLFNCGPPFLVSTHSLQFPLSGSLALSPPLFPTSTLLAILPAWFFFLFAARTMKQSRLWLLRVRIWLCFWSSAFQTNVWCLLLFRLCHKIQYTTYILYIIFEWNISDSDFC